MKRSAVLMAVWRMLSHQTTGAGEGGALYSGVLAPPLRLAYSSVLSSAIGWLWISPPPPPQLLLALANAVSSGLGGCAVAGGGGRFRLRDVCSEK